MPERIHIRQKPSSQTMLARAAQTSPDLASMPVAPFPGHTFEQIALHPAAAPLTTQETEGLPESGVELSMISVAHAPSGIQRRAAPGGSASGAPAAVGPGAANHLTAIQNASSPGDTVWNMPSPRPGHDFSRLLLQANSRVAAPEVMPRALQSPNAQQLILQRDPLPEEPVSRADSTSDPARVERLNALPQLIDAEAQANLTSRSQLDALQESGPERQRLEAQLDDGRQRLLDLIEEQIRLLETEIDSLNARIGPNPTSSAEHPELSDLGNELRDREQELQRARQQVEPLRRWNIRRQIGDLNAQIAAIDAELETLPPTCDANDPTSVLLFERREELVGRRDSLAASLTGSATEYEQFDPRWGSQRYGNSPECTNIAEAGCGPTSLAIVLNYLYREDPESLASSGRMEIVTPPQTAEYAATHGRVCNNGTAGDTMVTNVQTGFPGFAGRRITIDQAADQLRSGNLVIFLCKNCTGQNRSGGNKSYGGHYMVLNGVDAAGEVFNVLDPGANEANDILTITRTNLASHNNGFWIIERI